MDNKKTVPVRIQVSFNLENPEQKIILDRLRKNKKVRGIPVNLSIMEILSMALLSESERMPRYQLPADYDFEDMSLVMANKRKHKLDHVTVDKHKVIESSTVETEAKNGDIGSLQNISDDYDINPELLSSNLFSED